MRVISNSITTTVQPDGRTSVTELQNFDDGSKNTITYIAPTDVEPNWDFQAVADLRMQKTNNELELRDKQALEANNYQVPIGKRAFLALIPAQLRIALRTAATTNATLADALAYLDAGDTVYKSNADLWLNNLVSAGAITQNQKNQIMQAWTNTYG